MTEQRKLEIRNEAEKRMNLWLNNTSFDEMTVNGSLIRFNMALGLLGGYPFVPEEWMDSSEFNEFVTEKEFDSKEYDEIILGLFNQNL